MLPYPTLSLYDYFGNKNVTDDASVIIVQVVESYCTPQTASIQGGTYAVFEKGMATFRQLRAFCWPGGNMTVMYTASLSGLGSEYDLIAYQTLTFRMCRNGEILQNSDCVKCANGTYSLYFEWDGEVCRVLVYTTKRMFPKDSCWLAKIKLKFFSC